MIIDTSCYPTNLVDLAWRHDGEPFAHLQDVGVVGDERRGRAEVDDAFRGGRLQTVGVDDLGKDFHSAARMIELVRMMVREVNVPLNEAIAMATENPARAIGLNTKGCLTLGADADLVVLSPQLDVVRTFCSGEVMS